MKPARNDEAGMILVNVLMFVAIAAGLVLLMIEREEMALDRSLRVREAAVAAAAVRGGEVSAIVALRRDQLVAPDTDSPSEPWGALAENKAPIAGGTFDLAISDAEGKFNVNSLRSGAAMASIMFDRLAEVAGIDHDTALKAVELVRAHGPFTDLRPLRFAGFDPATVARLEQLVTALPGETAINLNTASPEVLAVLFRDPVIADRLVQVRARQGFLTTKDLDDQNVTQPPGTSFRSNTFWVRTRATVGDTVQQGATLIQRSLDEQGVRRTVPVERWLGAAVPPDAPAFGQGDGAVAARAG
ncbi:type II secretion system protein GspK [Sphingomonas donggukensis]|uniref:Type II secretion system protein K n=1 Tax=Sphingomonas donggukensis TaxID=2949093 RepID=A0ABY4TQB0_9SPHN|nr:type II secretion system protein GspK [Sphingomonas donggukensis]URW74576.1 type II secretion system protein GspK [Sphingomonas donggukensis]